MSAPFVIKLGGALMDSPSALAAICQQIAAMHASQPGCVVVVHGGGKAVDRQLAALGMPTERRDGIRITPPTGGRCGFVSLSHTNNPALK